MKTRTPYVAIGSRLRGVAGVSTLGLKPNFLDYRPEERRLMQDAELILYPTQNYAEFFSTLGKPIFPSLETHLYADEKIKQSTLFAMLGLPHPRTRFYYRRHFSEITKDFDFPFIAKIARRSARGRGVFLIASIEELKAYLELSPVAYIQEWIPHERDLRVVLVNYEPILAYWRIRQAGNFRANLAQGGRVVFGGVPEEALQLARNAAIQCRLDDVGLDLIPSSKSWLLIEANMKYGRKALELQGIDLRTVIASKLFRGELGRQRPRIESPPLRVSEE